MSDLTTQHPMMMIPQVISFSAVVYTNSGTPALSSDQLREAIISQLPPGTGVGCVTIVNHGIYKSNK